jgi:excisionase family DNA binding protein
MAKLMLNTFELSDFEKVVEKVLHQKLQSFIPKEKEELTLLSRKQTAKLLCISLPTLHHWTKSGVIKAYRIGNRILYKLQEINSSLNVIETSNKKGGLLC